MSHNDDYDDDGGKLNKKLDERRNVCQLRIEMICEIASCIRDSVAQLHRPSTDRST